jgi:hypothetical protein
MKRIWKIIDQHLKKQNKIIMDNFNLKQYLAEGKLHENEDDGIEYYLDEIRRDLEEITSDEEANEYLEDLASAILKLKRSETIDEDHSLDMVLNEMVNENKISSEDLTRVITSLGDDYSGKNMGVNSEKYKITTPNGDEIILTRSKDGKSYSYEPSNVALKVLTEAGLTLNEMVNEDLSPADIKFIKDNEIEIRNVLKISDDFEIDEMEDHVAFYDIKDEEGEVDIISKDEYDRLQNELNQLEVMKSLDTIEVNGKPLYVYDLRN